VSRTLLAERNIQNPTKKATFSYFKNPYIIFLNLQQHKSMLFRGEQAVEEYMYSLFKIISGESMDMDKLSQPQRLRLSCTVLGPWGH
jgi:hypothetical protein